MTRYTYVNHPFDVVGWDGYLYPYAFNIRDFEPIVGRLHMPPPVHETFEAPNLVVCSFVPRPFDFHPDAVPPAPGGLHPRSATGQCRSRPRQAGHRRDRRDDRHLPALDLGRAGREVEDPEYAWTWARGLGH
jgi:homogentisate 1,2-dioxygenase